MEKLKRKFLNDKKDLLVMLVRVAPFLGFELLLTILGFRIANLIPLDRRMIIQVAFWILFLVMLLLVDEPYWNFVLFLVFGVGAGLTLFWSSAGEMHPGIWILPVILVHISVLGRDLVQRFSGWMNWAVIISTVLFFLGWILRQFFTMPNEVSVSWIMLGLILFSIILMAIINNGVNQNQKESGLSSSIRLYVALFNLFWLSSVLYLAIH